MSNFGLTLSAIMDREDINQAELAKRSGVNDSIISRYRSGEQEWVSPDHLRKIGTAIFGLSRKAEDRAELLAAHLQDEIPSEWQNLVNVEMRGDKMKEAPLAYRVRLPEDLEEDFEVLRTWAVKNRHVRNIVTGIANVLETGDVRGQEVELRKYPPHRSQSTEIEESPAGSGDETGTKRIVRVVKKEARKISARAKEP